MTEDIKKVTYNKDTLMLIRKLSDINPELTIEKTNDNLIKIISRTPSRSLAYEFTAPIDVFDFESDSITFFNYKEFYTLFSVNNDPDIKQRINRFEICKDRSKLTYYLGEREATDEDDYEEVVDFEATDATYRLSSEDIKKFKTMISITKAEDLILKVEKDKVLMKLYYQEGQPTYEDYFDLDTSASEEFRFTVDTELIKLAPENDYIVDINSNGVVRLQYVNDNDITLNIYISEIEED